MRWVTAALTVLVLAAGCGDESSRVDQVVDELEENGQLQRYCASYRQTAPSGFSEEEAFANFSHGYTETDPPARAVFEEIRHRC